MINFGVQGVFEKATKNEGDSSFFVASAAAPG
jgi:hypothetical protein